MVGLLSAVVQRNGRESDGMRAILSRSCDPSVRSLPETSCPSAHHEKADDVGSPRCVAVRTTSSTSERAPGWGAAYWTGGRSVERASERASSSVEWCVFPYGAR